MKLRLCSSSLSGSALPSSFSAFKKQSGGVFPAAFCVYNEAWPRAGPRNGDTMLKTIALGLLLWNAAVFLLYLADKRRAQKGRRRVREKTLLACAFILGGAGALLGMYLPRHKTKHRAFRIGVPLALALQAALLLAAVYRHLWRAL